jgi:hypothetical protein
MGVLGVATSATTAQRRDSPQIVQLTPLAE